MLHTNPIPLLSDTPSEEEPSDIDSGTLSEDRDEDEDEMDDDDDIEDEDDEIYAEVSPDGRYSRVP